MRINRTFKYWEFYYDEDNVGNGIYDDTDETDRQCLASTWSDEWRDIKDIYNMEENELIDMLKYDMEVSLEKADMRKIKAAIRELDKIKKKLPLDSK